MQITVPKSLLRLAGKAIGDYSMIRPGDRVLLGLSGGKDSLSLLHVLRHFQRCSPVRFELGVVTIDPQSDGFQPAPLRAYVDQFGIPYFMRSEPIVALADKYLDNDSYCAFCARMKRGLMYDVARGEGYNVLALAQHLDDLAESFLMSAFHGGRLKTMKAHYRIDAGDLRVIRPFVYVRERQTQAFALAAELPVIVENCPACYADAKPTERMHTKQLLAREEDRHHRLFPNLLSALRPLMQQGLPPEESAAEAGETQSGESVTEARSSRRHSGGRSRSEAS